MPALAMADDTPALLFELARHAQSARLRRRRAHGGQSDDGAGPRAGRDAGDEAVPPRLSSTQRRGAAYEEQALALLVRAGLQPLACNLRCRLGEIDLALRDGDTLVLVEVRARAQGRFGGAAASVDAGKQRRLARTAACLLPGLAARHWRGREPRVRFDVVAFEPDGPVWLRHAFDSA
jgi:putative endonuclease